MKKTRKRKMTPNHMVHICSFLFIFNRTRGDLSIWCKWFQIIILHRLRVRSCHSDDIVLRIWQPLPPYVFDSAGERLHGMEQCYDEKKDGDLCTVPGCQVRYSKLGWECHTWNLSWARFCVRWCTFILTFLNKIWPFLMKICHLICLSGGVSRHQNLFKFKNVLI